MRVYSLALAIVLCCALSTSAQSPTTGGQPAPAPPPAAAEAEQAPDWSFAASVYTYLLADEANYAQPTLTADRGWLHLEARYNYEALDTGSAWIGFNVGGGETVEWEFTPMLGGVFGETTGIAPGYKASLGWRWVEFYSEGEYVFDANDEADSFFYNWTEWSLAPVAWFRAGLVTQRTRAYKTERDIQRGLLVGSAYRNLSGTIYVLNPDEGRPTVVIAVAVGF